MGFAWPLSFHLIVDFLGIGDVNVLYMAFLYSLRVLSMADFQVQQFYWLLRFFSDLNDMFLTALTHKKSILIS
jgi:hypothetical protein